MYYLVAAEFAKIGCSSASARYKFKVQYVLSLPHPTRLTRDGNSKSELLLKFQNHYHNFKLYLYISHPLNITNLSQWIVMVDPRNMIRVSTLQSKATVTSNEHAFITGALRWCHETQSRPPQENNALQIFQSSVRVTET